MNINEIDALVFDFDGVLSDNKVLVHQDGSESVLCNRADGLAFDVLRMLKLPTYILSTETNTVVTQRAKKLKVPVIQGASNKLETLSRLCNEEHYDINKVFFIGNDLNDFHVMKACGYNACPSDSHSKIKQISSHVFSSAGGEGVARELLEEIFNLDFIKILY
ncbi:HAD hydrolase family protein [Opitutales bacterium]|nr:HAD hydrolase family protein [Opitutales bacterium]